MSTEKQIAANRANAQHSTGPQSPEGKAAAAQNASRHGLCARGFIVLPGQEEAFIILETEYRLSLRPASAVEETLFTRILESAWNLHRCRLAEAELYLNCPEPTIDPLLDIQNEAKYARIHKYAKQAENSLVKMMRQLTELQTEAHFRDKVHPQLPDDLDDPEQFAPVAPQSLSAACSVREVLSRLHGAQTAIKFQNKANGEAFLNKFLAPPRATDIDDVMRRLRERNNAAAA